MEKETKNEEVVEKKEKKEEIESYYEAESWQFSGCGD